MAAKIIGTLTTRVIKGRLVPVPVGLKGKALTAKLKLVSTNVSTSISKNTKDLNSVQQ